MASCHESRTSSQILFNVEDPNQLDTLVTLWRGRMFTRVLETLIFLEKFKFFVTRILPEGVPVGFIKRFNFGVPIRYLYAEFVFRESSPRSYFRLL